MTDTMYRYRKRGPMTAGEAREVVSLMLRDTPKPARTRLLNVALEFGDLSAEARDVYRNALEQEG